MLLPEDLRAVTLRYWPPQDRPLPPREATAEKTDISIVTAFFDIGRTNWSVGGGTSPYRRSTEQYFGYFSNLARIKNQLVVFTEPGFAARILDLRRAAGLEEKTVIFTIAGLFDAPEIAPVRKAIARRMTPNFRRIVNRPDCPEYNEATYVLINALKASFACTAILSGAAEAPQVAWIDFGYCRDNQRFDPATPWRFDAQGKMNLFNIHALDDTPILQIVRSGDVYFSGPHMVGPRDAWFPFRREIDFSLNALLECDLVDDDQTLILMAWRRSPETYIAHAVDPGDWFVVFRRFNANAPLAPVTLPDERKQLPPLWLEDLRVTSMRGFKSLKKTVKSGLKRFPFAARNNV